MRNCLLTCLLLAIVHMAPAQTTLFVDSILENRTLKIPAYEIPDTDADNLILKMPYGQSSFLDTAGLSLLQNAQLLSVDLLFSDYPAASNLKTLNKNRLMALCQLMPTVGHQ